MRLLLLTVAAGLGMLFLSSTDARAGEPERPGAGFPILGGEYVFQASCRILPKEACDDRHIFFLEHGFGSWFRVAYNLPSAFSWKPPETGELWINLDRLNTLEQVPEDCRVIRLSGS